MRPKRTKPDANQAEIVAELRKLGYDVDIVCDLPGIFDIIVSGGFEYLTGDLDYYQITKECSVRVEIKSEKGKLNETEQKYYEAQNHKGSYIVARNVKDITDWFGRE